MIIRLPVSRRPLDYVVKRHNPRGFPTGGGGFGIRALMIAVSRLDDSKALTARFQAYSTGSKPTQRRPAEPSPFISHRRSEVAASLAWVESFPPLPEVDVSITPVNEKGELAISRSELSAKDGEVTLQRLVQLIERR